MEMNFRKTINIIFLLLVFLSMKSILCKKPKESVHWKLVKLRYPGEFFTREAEAKQNYKEIIARGKEAVKEIIEELKYDKTEIYSKKFSRYGVQGFDIYLRRLLTEIGKPSVIPLMKLILDKKCPKNSLIVAINTLNWIKDANIKENKKLFNKIKQEYFRLNDKKKKTETEKNILESLLLTVSVEGSKEIIKHIKKRLKSHSIWHVRIGLWSAERANDKSLLNDMFKLFQRPSKITLYHNYSKILARILIKMDRYISIDKAIKNLKRNKEDFVNKRLYDFLRMASGENLKNNIKTWVKWWKKNKNKYMKENKNK